MSFQEQIIEKRRQVIRRIMEDTCSKDVEYGYCRGNIDDALRIKEKKEQVEKDLSCDIRGCPLAGAMRYSLTTPNSLPLLHGPEGCAFWTKNFWMGAGALFLMPQWPVITTAMAQEDVFFGGEEALRRAIISADKYYRPSLIVPINTCAGAIIGDDIEGVCDSLRNEVSCLLAPVSLPGFCSRNQALGYEYWLMAMAKHVMKEQKETIPLSINYVGESYGTLGMEVPFPTDLEEIDRILHQMGVKIHCYIPGSSVEKLIEAPKAQLNLIRCMSAGIKFARYMKEHFGIDFVGSSIPFGIQATTEFYMGIIEGLSLGKEAERILQREIEETEKALEPYRRILRGKRFALTAAAGRTTPLALVFMELGMEPVYIGYHFLREKTFLNIEGLKEVLEEKGYEPEIMVEPAYYESEEVVRRLRPDIFFCDFGERHIGMHYGIPTMEIMMGFLPSGPIQGYRGTLTWAQTTIAMLENPLFKEKGPLLYPYPYASPRYLEKKERNRP